MAIGRPDPNVSPKGAGWGRVTLVCNRCGASFLAYRSVALRAKTHYCTQECQFAGRSGSSNPNWRGGNVRRTCLNCEQSFEVYAATAKQGLGNYCSFPCRKSHLRIYPTNEIRKRELGRQREARVRASRRLHGHHTHAEWIAVLCDADNRCVKCGSTERIEKDHIIPLSRGGTDLIDNIQPLCRSCNRRKWAKLP